MPAPPKKMHHLQAINAIPSQYPEFRNVLWTGESSQLVVMTVPVGGDIGEEVHSVDQHLIFTSGVCKAIVAGEEKEVKAGDMVIVPQGTKHNCRFILECERDQILTYSHQHRPNPFVLVHSLRTRRARRDYRPQDQGRRR
jgi:mannose-6-phosphate isomerase-like protein (cupin superfamily)